MVPFDHKSIIVTGSANPELAQAVVQNLHTRLGNVSVGKFNDGEVRVEVNEYVSGHHVFIIQPTCSPVNDNLMELLVMIDALKRSDVKSVTAIVPYYGYSRQDRRLDFSRTPITSRLVADLLITAGIDRMITVDIHSDQQKGFFPNRIPYINIAASPEMVAHIWRTHWDDSDRMIVVSPDAGGVARARAVAKQLEDADLAIIDKRRPQPGEASVMNVIGDVEDKVCVVIDDLIDTARTLCKGADALKERGARKVVAYATHGVFSGSAIETITQSQLDKVVITDSIPWEHLDEKIEVISVAGLIAETIRRLRQHKSVSEMYVGAQ